jgi:hypothetical protein
MSANGGAPDERAALSAALAAHFGFDVEELSAYIVICERNRTTVSSAWAGAPHWALLGLVDELRSHIERLRAQADLEHALSGEPGG